MAFNDLLSDLSPWLLLFMMVTDMTVSYVLQNPLSRMDLTVEAFFVYVAALSSKVDLEGINFEKVLQNCGKWPQNYRIEMSHVISLLNTVDHQS